MRANGQRSIKESLPMLPGKVPGCMFAKNGGSCEGCAVIGTCKIKTLLTAPVRTYGPDTRM